MRAQREIGGPRCETIIGNKILIPTLEKLKGDKRIRMSYRQNSRFTTSEPLTDNLSEKELWFNFRG